MTNHLQSTPNEDDELDELLLLGQSSTILEVSEAITSNIVEFKHVYHLETYQQAKRTIEEKKISTVILDDDDPNLNVITISSLIYMYNPQIRILLATSEVSVSLLKTIINYTPIKDLIILPVESYSVYHKIIEQQTKYGILRLITESLNNPPKFSPAYYDILSNTPSKTYQIIGASISINSIVQYSYIDEKVIGVNENLMSLFITAISQISSDFSNDANQIQEMKIGSTYILYYFIGNIQYSFFIKDYIPTHKEEITQTLEVIIQEFEDNLIKPQQGLVIITEDLDKKFISILQENLPQVQFHEAQPVKNPNLYLFNLKAPKIYGHLNEIRGDFTITIMDDEEKLIEDVYDGKPDMIIVYHDHAQQDEMEVLVQIVKEIDPTLLLIQCIDNPTVPCLLKRIREGFTDFVIFANDSQIRFLNVMQQARSKYISTKKEESSILKQNIDWYTSREDFVKSIYRRKETLRSYSQLKVPMLYSLYIFKERKLVYQKLWEELSEITYLDPHKFNKVILSLRSFNKEIDKMPENALGIKFGTIQIIIREVFDFLFVFIVGNIDEYNIYMVNNALDEAISTIIDLLLDHDLNRTINLQFMQIIEQNLVELYMKCSSLSF